VGACHRQAWANVLFAPGPIFSFISAFTWHPFGLNKCLEVFWGSVGRQILRDSYQGMGLADKYPLPSRFEEALMLPTAEDTANGVEGSTSHLAQVLSRERQANQHPIFHFLPGLLGQA
jgi:hypothetical protein